jgi:hypothetical protein
MGARDSTAHHVGTGSTRHAHWPTAPRLDSRRCNTPTASSNRAHVSGCYDAAPSGLDEAEGIWHLRSGTSAEAG